LSFGSIAHLKALHTALDRIIKHPGLAKIIERKDNCSH
jgi:hypothetical protein